MPRIILDLETRSEADLEEVGGWNYSKHPSTSALCVAITNEDGNVIAYDLTTGQWPKEWEIAVREGWEIWAWNVAFEYSIVTNCLRHWPQPRPDQWRDAAHQAVVASRPAKLAVCAKTLDLAEQKDVNGTALINFFCKPVATGERKGKFREPRDNPERFQQLMDYCAQDVRTTKAIMDALPAVTPEETQYWLDSWEMNRRGIYIDVPLVNALVDMTDTSRRVIGAKLEAETGLTSSDMSDHSKVRQYVQSTGIQCDSVSKAAVKETLSGTIPEKARTVLEARQALGKTSVAKLPALLREVGDDSRLRFCIRTHGTYTGRDSGMGIQPQNLPRGAKGIKPDALIPLALNGETDGFLANCYAKNGDLRIFDPMGGIVACIRGCFAAAPGKVMLQCDWSAIEPRIGAWVVGDDFMLDAFRKIDTEGGYDIYQIEAARFYGCSPAEITGDRRQMGKVFVLQNQYESGEKSIQRAAKEQYGLALDIDTCIQAKDVWRVTHPKWVQMWRSLNDGALSALRNQGRVFRVGKAAFVFNGRDLRFRLPCGRVITYADASIKQAAAPWGEMRDAVHCYTLLHGHWVEDTIHGGAFFNALVQGLGASLMRHATRNLTAAGFDIIMRIHDEILVEADSPEQFAQFKKIMLTPPPWALDLPINGAGWIGPRFKKD